ncbi:MAG: hypothetical protein JXR51_05990 [Bacteroidales bacterium]|nr:hypothetical protein [Bacteroidales bacterium]MBN2756711.1 hypothetical protein [Bacteroidales bacterium]
MKKNKIIPLAILFVLFLFSCNKDDEKVSKVDENGLTEEINNLVPASVLEEIESLGMPINGGDNPPNMEKSYLASPFILKASNRESDYIGLQFADYYFQFYDQDNDNLTIKLSYLNGPESGDGIGGFIVGDDNKFTVFAEIQAVAYEETVQMVHIISGTLATDGIDNLYFANFMLDNNGNPNGYWIEDGEGRVIYDSDGFSEEVTSFKSKVEIEIKSASMK